MNLSYEDIKNKIIVLNFKMHLNKKEDAIEFNMSGNKNGIRMKLSTFFNEIVKGETIFYKVNGNYKVYVPLQNFWLTTNKINLQKLTEHFGSIEHISPKITWQIFWYKHDNGKLWFYLPNGDDNLDLGYKEDMISFCKKYNLELSKNMMYVTGYPNLLINDGLTDLNILTWHIETCKSKEVWLEKK